ncbi:MAG: hypothetical protein ACFFDH_06015, partial [Promethearchaeota archaeon]
CQNCGTTNNELNTRICRNCGSLLPIPSKSNRERGKKIVPEKKKKKKETKKVKKETINSAEKLKEDLILEEIPKQIDNNENLGELHEIPTTSKEKFTTPTHEEKEHSVLQEIPAQPFKGSIINSQGGISKPKPIPKPLPLPLSRSENVITDALTELKSSILEEQNKEQEVSLTPIPSEKTKIDESILKQKQLEKDMTEVLGFLSKKISVKKLDIPKVKEQKKEEPKEEIPPSSMNEILNRLLTLDLHIEASAIIKSDGTILASATSNRISDSLFATIGMNLSMIGSDIIEGLSAGTLKSISLKATKGVLDLAPIDKANPSVKDMFLILFSHSKVKSGIISFAVNIVKKQIKEYLGLKKA